MQRYPNDTKPHLSTAGEDLIMLNRYKLNKVAYTIVIITTNGQVYFTDVNDCIFLVYNYSN